MNIERLTPFEASPATAGLFLDFDGTLAEIVHVPHEARPLEGARDLLTQLADRLALVAIVSGRSAYQLVEWLGPDLEIWGVHGAQRVVAGEVVLSDLGSPFQELMRKVRDEAAAELATLDLDGVLLEDKTVMIGLHFRGAADRERARAALDALAEDLARRHGLIRAGGRLAFELRPPADFSKAAVVLRRAREAALEAVAFVGDDRVDLPGFDALDVLEGEGMATLRVAVDSDEAPPELLARADVILDGPASVLGFLRSLGDQN